MRLRIQRKIRKALSAQEKVCLEPTRLPAIVRDRNADPDLRGLAARMLSFDKRHRDPFGPLFAHLIESEGYRSIELSRAIAQTKHAARPNEEMAAFARDLRSSPDEAHRVGIVDALREVAGTASGGLLIEAMEREGESISVRSSAAENLQDHPHRDTLHAYARCLANPDPEVRFWAAFGLGSMSSDKPAYHRFATEALTPLVNDAGAAPEFWWPVGYEARAMLANWDREVWAGVQAESATIQSNPEADARLRRWAETYGERLPPRGRRFA